MTRLYDADYALAPCPTCRRLHDSWHRRVLDLGAPSIHYTCPYCETDAPRDLALPTEYVFVGRAVPQLDTTDWPAAEPA